MPADLQSLVAPRLPRAEYPSAADGRAMWREVVEWVKYGLSYLDPYATILGVERFLDRTYYPEDGSGPIPVGRGHRLAPAADRQQRQTIHRDRRLQDRQTPRWVIVRSGLFPVRPETAVDATLPGEGFAPVDVHRAVCRQAACPHSELTLERCLADWEEVKRTLAAIAAESTWAPTPSPLCEWCPFNGNGCEPTREEENLSLW